MTIHLFENSSLKIPFDGCMMDRCLDRMKIMSPPEEGRHKYCNMYKVGHSHINL